ncbi:hypothetical protein ALC62_03016, partial [Cyphomyrmex costatus]
LNSLRIHVNCQAPSSLITTIDELERNTDSLVKSREYTHCLSNESGVVAQKYRKLVDSRRVASRIRVTYRARINPRRLYNLSPFSVCAVPFFRASALFFLHYPVRPYSWSFSRIDVTHASQCI